MSAPSVSIVVTCHNYGQYVSQAVDSALAQTYPNIEVIVVDDGSTDKSAVILQHFGERITLIRQENRGHVGAINRGYAACRGDIVLFVDADDVLRSDAVATVVDAWSAECTKVQFELDIIDGDGELLGRRFCNYVEPYGPEQIAREFARFGTYVWPVLTGNAYTRSFLDQLMPLTIARAPDGYLNTIAPLYGEIRTVTKALAFYRLHDANQSYHANESRSIGTRFAKRVSLRTSELRHLAERAQARAVTLPSGNLLDHDLAFINYRLMLKRLGVSYENESSDRPRWLWWAGLTVLLRRPLPKRLKLGHALWLTALFCSPRSLASRAIELRFNRAALLQPLRRKLRSSSRDASAADDSIVSHSG